MTMYKDNGYIVYTYYLCTFSWIIRPGIQLWRDVAEAKGQKFIHSNWNIIMLVNGAQFPHSKISSIPALEDCILLWTSS